MALKKKKQRNIRGPHHKGAPEMAPKQPDVIAEGDYPDGLSVEEIIAKRELKKKSASE